MKKTILAAATFSVLMASGMANAAFTDADASGNWGGDLEFNGTITNTNPAWKYQIPDAAVAAAKNWDIERASGSVDGNNTNFVFPKNLNVLEGVMKAPTALGGAGMQPIVTFGEGANKVVFDTTETTPATKTVTVNAKKGSTSVGNLSMSLNLQVATQGVVIANNNIASDAAYQGVEDAFAMLKSQPYYNATYSSNSGSIEYPNARRTLWLGSSDVSKMSSALTVTASGFKASFPTASIPDAWTATLPISITVK